MRSFFVAAVLLVAVISKVTASDVLGEQFVAYENLRNVMCLPHDDPHIHLLNERGNIVADLVLANPKNGESRLAVCLLAILKSRHEVDPDLKEKLDKISRLQIDTGGIPILKATSFGPGEIGDLLQCLQRAQMLGEYFILAIGEMRYSFLRASPYNVQVSLIADVCFKAKDRFPDTAFAQAIEGLLRQIILDTTIEKHVSEIKTKQWFQATTIRPAGEIPDLVLEQPTPDSLAGHILRDVYLLVDDIAASYLHPELDIAGHRAVIFTRIEQLTGYDSSAGEDSEFNQQLRKDIRDKFKADYESLLLQLELRDTITSAVERDFRQAFEKRYTKIKEKAENEMEHIAEMYLHWLFTPPYSLNQGFIAATINYLSKTITGNPHFFSQALKLPFAPKRSYLLVKNYAEDVLDSGDSGKLAYLRFLLPVMRQYQGLGPHEDVLGMLPPIYDDLLEEAFKNNVPESDALSLARVEGGNYFTKIFATLRLLGTMTIKQRGWKKSFEAILDSINYDDFHHINARVQLGELARKARVLLNERTDLIGHLSYDDIVGIINGDDLPAKPVYVEPTAEPEIPPAIPPAKSKKKKAKPAKVPEPAAALAPVSAVGTKPEAEVSPAPEETIDPEPTAVPTTEVKKKKKNKKKKEATELTEPEPTPPAVPEVPAEPQSEVVATPAAAPVADGRIDSLETRVTDLETRTQAPTIPIYIPGLADAAAQLEARAQLLATGEYRLALKAQEVFVRELNVWVCELLQKLKDTSTTYYILDDHFRWFFENNNRVGAGVDFNADCRSEIERIYNTVRPEERSYATAQSHLANLKAYWMVCDQLKAAGHAHYS